VCLRFKCEFCCNSEFKIYKVIDRPANHDNEKCYPFKHFTQTLQYDIQQVKLCFFFHGNFFKGIKCDGGFGRTLDNKLCSGLDFTRGIEAKFQLYQTGDTNLSCHRDFVFQRYYSTQRILAEN
jgi:hypothetical protein